MLYSLAFAHITFNSPIKGKAMLDRYGTAENIYAARTSIPDIKDDWTEELSWAETEKKWCEQKHIRILPYNHADYPQRLRQCADAPAVLFYRGTADLNATHIISIVGTRNSTAYGRDVIRTIIADLKRDYDDVVVVSGLAYGIDIEGHRTALDSGFETVGVLAHGLDTIYPASHRDTAIKMLYHGGLLTEYPSHSRGDKANFLHRNRIVAGISDATIIVESLIRGGSLSTARLAREYGRTVFAVPGRITDKTSEGCNDLIATRRALPLTCANDIVKNLGWISPREHASATKGGIEQDIFANLSPNERLIVDALRDADLHINNLSMATAIPISSLPALLFAMEMKGLLRPLAGNIYHLMYSV